MATIEINPKPYLPRTIEETREDALARVREEHGTPTVVWEDRPVRDFRVPEGRSLFERMRGIKGKAMAGALAVAVMFGATELIANSMDRSIKVQDKQIQIDKQHLARAEKLLGNTTGNP